MVGSHRTKPRRAALTATAAFAGLALSQVATPAMAVECPMEMSFAAPVEQTLEYGQFWLFPVASSDSSFIEAYSNDGLTISSTGTPAGYAPLLYLTGGTSYSGHLSPSYDVAPLGTGSYTFAIAATAGYSAGACDSYAGSTVPPASLTVAPAMLGIELRVLADPNNADAAIVTAKFTGRFADEYQSSFFAGAATSPAGVWRISIADREGTVATERSIERAAGDDILSTSFYWADADPEKQYTATAEFQPTGESAENFEITAAPAFSYTASPEQRPVPASTATAEPAADLPAATEFGLPLWLLILVIVLVVGLGTLVTIFSVRLSKRPALPNRAVTV